jgi:hypothetical protein
MRHRLARLLVGLALSAATACGGAAGGRAILDPVRTSEELGPGRSSDLGHEGQSIDPQRGGPAGDDGDDHDDGHDGHDDDHDDGNDPGGSGSPDPGDAEAEIEIEIDEDDGGD